MKFMMIIILISLLIMMNIYLFNLITLMIMSLFQLKVNSILIKVIIQFHL